VISSSPCEFKFPYTVWDPHGEEEITHSVTVPWDAVKQIMAAIRDHAALSAPPEPIDQFTLYESRLGHDGAHYEAVAEFPLR